MATAAVRFLKKCRSWHSYNLLNSTAYSSSAPSKLQHRSLLHRPFYEHRLYPNTPKGLRLKSVSELPEFCSILPAILAGVFGMGVLEMSHAEAREADPQSQSASELPSNYGGIDKFGSQERKQLEELLRNRGMQRGSYPSFSVAVKGQQVTIKFQIPPTCEISHLIVDLVSRLGLNAEEHGGGSEMIMRAWDRGRKLGGIGIRLKIRISMTGIYVFSYSNHLLALRMLEIEDTILLALQSPEVYDDIARGTRCKFESNRPRAVLFEGPPGTGKTSCARVIANQAGVPLLYVPLEIVMSKYYGESERLLGTVFSLANELSSGAIIFLDEVDSFAVARDNEMHEATRRILSVLLRQIDGFEQEKRVVVIAATNRKQDLDPALISRFDSMITFSLPDQQTREEIAAQYARHLKKSELGQFAAVTEELSGRDIRDVCQQAERHWASKIIRGEVRGDDAEQGLLPPIQEYIESAHSRRKALLDVAEKRNQNSDLKKKPLAFA
ncbi:uncharacterized protein LOC131240775 isoform X3 [Magnolia sinica]|uniref:uncharacterized protein LOC131240775 isoform X3 n=1 Tax=Magnolia sinica TaxID=86752 RepID=UPI0026596885|nr:uncharacterized protein LOC131240775 isoform X3 [Magnolia sinica]